MPWISRGGNWIQSQKWDPTHSDCCPVVYEAKNENRTVTSIPPCRSHTSDQQVISAGKLFTSSSKPLLSLHTELYSEIDKSALLDIWTTTNWMEDGMNDFTRTMMLQKFSHHITAISSSTGKSSWLLVHYLMLSWHGLVPKSNWF